MQTVWCISGNHYYIGFIYNLHYVTSTFIASHINLKHLLPAKQCVTAAAHQHPYQVKTNKRILSLFTDFQFLRSWDDHAPTPSGEAQFRYDPLRTPSLRVYK